MTRNNKFFLKGSVILLLTQLYSLSIYTQEFLHLQLLENKKTERIKTETVWQIPTTDKFSENKTLYSYHKFDCHERIVALRMYSNDTILFSYDSLGQQKRKELLPYNIEIDSSDTFLNLTFYNHLNLDSLQQHYEADKLIFETKFNYNSQMKCVQKINCRYTESSVCDTIFYTYNNLFQKIYSKQKFYNSKKSLIYIDERTWTYDKKGRIITGTDNENIYKYSYDLKGYLKKVKGYNRNNGLSFFVKYEYTFWTKKEMRNCES